MAAPPSWFPQNSYELVKKCNEDNNITPEMEDKYSKLYNNTISNTIVLCRVKSLNIYSEKTGFYVDRMAQMLYEDVSYRETRIPMMQNCVDQYKDLTSHAEKVVNTIKCITEAESKERNRLNKN